MRKKGKTVGGGMVYNYIVIITSGVKGWETYL